MQVLHFSTKYTEGNASHQPTCKKQDLRPGHGMYNKKKKSILVEIPSTHAEVYTSNNPSF